MVKDLAQLAPEMVWNPQTLNEHFNNINEEQIEKCNGKGLFGPISFTKASVTVQTKQGPYILTRLQAQCNKQIKQAFLMVQEPDLNLMSRTIELAMQQSLDNVVIMPDGHLTNTNIVGFSARMQRDENGEWQLAPLIIGADIGCGVLSAQLNPTITIADQETFLKTLDQAIVKKIPAGMAAEHDLATLDKDFYAMIKTQVEAFLHQSHFYKTLSPMEQECLVVNIVANTATLGAGNHFIEINQTDAGQMQLNIHSGSRTFGGKVDQYYQKLATNYNKQQKQVQNGAQSEWEALVKLKRSQFQAGLISASELNEFFQTNKPPKKNKDTSQQLLTLTGQMAQDYFHDLKIAEAYGQFNRKMMMQIIEEAVRAILNLAPEVKVFQDQYHNIHNSAFLVANEVVLLKGAILGQVQGVTNEQAVAHPNAIPLNMQAGIISAKPVYDQTSGGQFNFALPHGAGRYASRKQFVSQDRQAKWDNFQKQMQGIVSSCVVQDTLDESPAAYKSQNEILAQSVALIDQQNLKIFQPLYSFKGHNELPFMKNIATIKRSNEERFYGPIKRQYRQQLKENNNGPNF